MFPGADVPNTVWQSSPPQPSVLPILGHPLRDVLATVASPAHRQHPAIAVGAPSTPNARPHHVLLHGEAKLPDAAWGSDLPQWKICPPPHPSAVYRAERLWQPRTKGPCRNNGGSTKIATKPQTKGRGDERRERGREQHPLWHAVPVGCLGQGRGAWSAICEPLRRADAIGWGHSCSRVTALGARRCRFHHHQCNGGVLAASRLLLPISRLLTGREHISMSHRSPPAPPERYYSCQLPQHTDGAELARAAGSLRGC